MKCLETPRKAFWIQKCRVENELGCTCRSVQISQHFSLHIRYISLKTVENHKRLSVKKFEIYGCAVSTHVSYSGGLASGINKETLCTESVSYAISQK